MADDASQLVDWAMSNPRAAWRALDCADAKESLAHFCGMIEVPGAPIGDEPEDDTADHFFAPVETPPAAHHRLLISKLQDLAEGRIVHEGRTVRRMMVFMPPGSAKSTYASVVFPAWFIGQRPRLNVGVATHTTDLARKMGRRMRSIIRQPAYREIFDVGLAADQSSASEWALDNGNEFMGAGILAGWTGNRLDGLVIDDPVKTREEADSPIVQAKIRSEFDDSLMSRLKPNAWAVIIQTRWSEKDLSGGLLPSGWNGESGVFKCSDGRLWYVLCIPAEAEANDPLGRAPGVMLWPEWFGLDPDFWTAARSNPRTWSALYQQRPRPPDGVFFYKAWFDGGVVESPMGSRVYARRRFTPGQQPKNLRIYLTSDHAPTDGPKSDSNGVRVWGIDAIGDVWMLGGAKGRMRMDQLGELIVGNLRDPHRKAENRPPLQGLIREWRPWAWFPEDDNNWKAVEPFVLRRAKEEGVAVRIEPIPPQGSDKATRAQAAQAMAAMGRVHYPEGEEGDAAVKELVGFAAGAAHDEEVDLLAVICRALDMAHPAIVKPEPEEEDTRGIGQATFAEALRRSDELQDEPDYIR
jgi:predicted phage terminase large subunit-like protein